MAPIPMVVSFAVQKWNWCGVAGFSSVATTRPTGIGRLLSIMTPSSGGGTRPPGAGPLAAAPQVGLHVVYRIQQAVPARVGRGDRGALAQQPAGQRRGLRDARGVGARLDTEQPVEQVVALPGPQPQIPGGHRLVLVPQGPKRAGPVVGR